MSFLHIIYRGWTATAYNDEESNSLDRYINMDTGQICYTMGKQIGGKTINPNSGLGKSLIKNADFWIRNPDTKWVSHSKWFEPGYGEKYPPFKYEGPSNVVNRKTESGCLLMVLIFLIPISAFLFSAIL